MIKRILLQLWKRLPIPFWGQWVLLWLTTQKFLVGVVGIVLDRDNRLLLLNHTYRSKYPWGLPSGWLKAGEDASQAIAREIFEETNLKVIVVRPLVVGRSLERPRLDLIFLCKYVEGMFEPTDEVSGAEFFKLNELPAILPSQLEIVNSFYKNVDEMTG